MAPERRVTRSPWKSLRAFTRMLLHSVSPLASRHLSIPPRSRCCVPCLHDVDSWSKSIPASSCSRSAKFVASRVEFLYMNPRSFAATASSNARCSEWGGLPPDMCRLLLTNEKPDACRTYEDQERSRAGNSNPFTTPLYERSTNGLHSVAATGKGSASSSAPRGNFAKENGHFWS